MNLGTRVSRIIHAEPLKDAVIKGRDGNLADTETTTASVSNAYESVVKSQNGSSDWPPNQNAC